MQNIVAQHKIILIHPLRRETSGISCAINFMSPIFASNWRLRIADIA
jgi:hypothetical protein